MPLPAPAPILPGDRHGTGQATEDPALSPRPPALRALPEDYRPAMVVSLAEAAGTADAVEIGAALGQMDLEALRIIARMTPEQIDALTLLILSQSPAGTTTGAPDLPGPAPWIGDWTTAAPAVLPPRSRADEVPEAWTVTEDRQGRVFLRNDADHLSRIEIDRGLVLGHLGRVVRITRSGSEIEVETDGGMVLRGPREGAGAPAKPVTQAGAPDATGSGQDLAGVAPPARPAGLGTPGARPPQDASADATRKGPAPATGPAPRSEPGAGAAADRVAATAAGSSLIQVASFRNLDNARSTMAALAAAGLSPAMDGPQEGSGLYRILVGPVRREDRSAVFAILDAAGFDDAFALPASVPPASNP